MSAYFILDVLPVKQGERQFWTLTLLKMKRRYITPNVTICNIGFSKVLASSAPFDIPFNGRNRCWISVLFNTLAQKEYERLPAELENKDCLFYPRNTQTEKIVSLLSLKSSLENEDYMDAVPKMNKAYFERQRICIPSQAEALWNRLFADTENIGSDVLYIFYYKDYFVCTFFQEDLQNFSEEKKGGFMEKLFDRRKNVTLEFSSLFQYDGQGFHVCAVTYVRDLIQKLSDTAYGIPIAVTGIYELFHYEPDMNLVGAVNDFMLSQIGLQIDNSTETILPENILPVCTDVPVPYPFSPQASSQRIQYSVQEDDEDDPCGKETPFEWLLSHLKDSPTKLTPENINFIQNHLPFPKEYRIRYARVDMDKAWPSGLAIANEVMVFRASKEQLEEYNRRNDTKERDLYHLVTADNYMDYEFHVVWNEDEGSDIADIYFGEIKIIDKSNTDRLDALRSVYGDRVLSCSVSDAGASPVGALYVGGNFVPISKGVNMQAKQAKGELAENAIALWNKLWFNRVEILGRNNAKNGPDLSINGKPFQVKFHERAEDAARGLFGKNGDLRYQENGTPMDVIVARGNKDGVVNYLAEKGIPDAETFVHESCFTAKEMERLAEGHFSNAIFYASMAGIDFVKHQLGPDFIVNYILEYWAGHDKKEAARLAFFSTVKRMPFIITYFVASTTIARTMIGYLSRDKVTAQMAGICWKQFVSNVAKAVLPFAGQPVPKTPKALVRQGEHAILGSGLYFAVSLIGDNLLSFYSSCKNNNSWGEYFRNLMQSLAAVPVSGCAAYAISAFCPEWVVASFIGQTIVSVLAGAAGIGTSMAVDSFMDRFVEHDNQATARLLYARILHTINIYLLNQEEASDLCRKIQSKDIQELLNKVRGEAVQLDYIDNILKGIALEVTGKRPLVTEIPDEESTMEFLTEAVKDSLGETSTDGQKE